MSNENTVVQTDKENGRLARRMLREFVPTESVTQSWAFGEADVTLRYMRALGPKSSRWRALVEHPVQGWSFALELIYRGDQLVDGSEEDDGIDEYFADDSRLIPDTDQACLAVNDWLQSL